MHIHKHIHTYILCKSQKSQLTLIMSDLWLCGVDEKRVIVCGSVQVSVQYLNNLRAHLVIQTYM